MSIVCDQPLRIWCIYTLVGLGWQCQEWLLGFIVLWTCKAVSLAISEAIDAWSSFGAWNVMHFKGLLQAMVFGIGLVIASAVGSYLCFFPHFLYPQQLWDWLDQESPKKLCLRLPGPIQPLVVMMFSSHLFPYCRSRKNSCLFCGMGQWLLVLPTEWMQK